MSTWRAYAAPSEKLQRGGETFFPPFHRATVRPMFACQIIMSPSMPEICSNADCKKNKKNTVVLEYNRTYNIPLTVHKGHGLDYIFNVSVMQDQAQQQHSTLHGFSQPKPGNVRWEYLETQFSSYSSKSLRSTLLEMAVAKAVLRKNNPHWGLSMNNVGTLDV